MSEVDVLRDSVLCFGGKCHKRPEAAQLWTRDRMVSSTTTPRFRRRSSGICVENYAGHTTVQILEEIQKMLAGANVQPSQLRGWGIWLSMYNNTNGHQKHSEEICKQSETRLASCAKDCEPSRWSPLGPGDEEKLYASSIDNSQEKWNATAEIMKQDFASSGYPLSRYIPTLERRALMYGRWKTDHSLQRGPKFCRYAVRDQCRRQPAPY